VEEVTPPAKIMELESKVKLMSEQIEALQEAIAVYEELISRLKPRQIKKLLLE
jgi:rubrerythrin